MPRYLMAWYLLRSAVFYVGYVVSVVIHSSFMLMFGFLMPFRWRYRLLIVWNRFSLFWLRWTCGIRCEAEGLENLPDHAVVVISNHQSSWETLYLATLFTPLCTLIKRELLWIPFFGWGLVLMRPIAINRGVPRAALKQMMVEGGQRLANDSSVLIFPQGTRVEAGKELRFARGAAQLAIRSGADIVVIAHDAGDCWPARCIIKFPGVIHVAVSTPMASSSGDAAELTTRAQSWIEDRLAGWSHT